MSQFVKLYRDFIIPNFWALDIGANVGLASLAIGELRASKVISFEPNPECFNKLKNNCTSNIYDLYNLACDNVYRTTEFAYGEDNSGIMEGFSVQEERGNGKRMNFECVDTLDFILDKYGLEDLKKIKFIKIDAEGMDYIILKNLKPLIKWTKPNIIIEWWGHISKNKFIFDIVKELCYTPYRSDNREIASEDQFNNRSNDLILLPN